MQQQQWRVCWMWSINMQERKQKTERKTRENNEEKKNAVWLQQSVTTFCNSRLVASNGVLWIAISLCNIDSVRCTRPDFQWKVRRAHFERIFVSFGGLRWNGNTLPYLFSKRTIEFQFIWRKLDIYLLIYWRVSTNWSLMTIRQLKVWLMCGILVQLTRHTFVSFNRSLSIEFKIFGPTAMLDTSMAIENMPMSIPKSIVLFWKIQYSSLIRRIHYGLFTMIACQIDLFILSDSNRVGKLCPNKLRILNWTFFIFNKYPTWISANRFNVLTVRHCHQILWQVI